MLKGSERIIFDVLKNECDGHHEWVKMSFDDLAQITFYHPNTIKMALMRLAEEGIVKRRRSQNGTGRPYEYQINEEECYFTYPDRNSG